MLMLNCSGTVHPVLLKFHIFRGEWCQCVHTGTTPALSSDYTTPHLYMTQNTLPNWTNTPLQDIHRGTQVIPQDSAP